MNFDNKYYDNKHARFQVVLLLQGMLSMMGGIMAMPSLFSVDPSFGVCIFMGIWFFSILTAMAMDALYSIDICFGACSVFGLFTLIIAAALTENVTVLLGLFLAIMIIALFYFPSLYNKIAIFILRVIHCFLYTMTICGGVLFLIVIRIILASVIFGLIGSTLGFIFGVDIQKTDGNLLFKFTTLVWVYVMYKLRNKFALI